MSAKTDPWRIVTHKNGARQWVGTPTAEQEAWLLAMSVGVNSFPSARSRSAETEVKQDRGQQEGAEIE